MATTPWSPEQLFNYLMPILFILIFVSLIKGLKDIF